jgi:hypothetical protein
MATPSLAPISIRLIPFLKSNNLISLKSSSKITNMLAKYPADQ